MTQDEYLRAYKLADVDDRDRMSSLTAWSYLINGNIKLVNKEEMLYIQKIAKKILLDADNKIEEEYTRNFNTISLFVDRLNLVYSEATIELFKESYGCCKPDLIKAANITANSIISIRNEVYKIWEYVETKNDQLTTGYLNDRHVKMINDIIANKIDTYRLVIMPFEYMDDVHEYKPLFTVRDVLVPHNLNMEDIMKVKELVNANNKR